MSGKAKKTYKQYGKNTAEYAYPSRYGSHNSMVDSELTAKLKNDTFVVLKDEHGAYITEKKLLDSGVADSYRNASTEYRENLVKEHLGET